MREAVLCKCDAVLSFEVGAAVPFLVKSIVDIYQQRAREIKDICLVPTYNLAFEGEVGSGKTTAIASLLSLIDNSGKSLREKICLPTGSGSVTSCRVILKPSDTSKNWINVIPMSTDTFATYATSLVLIGVNT